MLSFRDSIVFGVREADAKTAVEPSLGVAYELELRVGIVREGAFTSNVHETLFFASYAVLSELATTRTEKLASRNESYSETIRCERVGALAPRWTEKTQLRVSNHLRPLTDTWFDARLSLSRERHIEEPESVREARAIAARVRSPLDNDRTRAASPTRSRLRERRSLTFADAPSWRLDWTVVRVTDVRLADTGFAEPQHVFASPRYDTHEIELEYVGRTSSSPEDAADEALRLLGRLSNALGATRVERARRLAADQRAFERRLLI